MYASNSAAQVSTRLNDGTTPSALRSRRTSVSRACARGWPAAGRRSRAASPPAAAPASRARPAGRHGRAVGPPSRPARGCCSGTSGSILRALVNVLDDHAGLEGVADVPDALRRRRRQPGDDLLDASAASGVPQRSARSQPRPKRPVSRPRSAFCSDSLNVRPMAIVSPTDFICVVSVGSASGNFSKAQRGTLVTT